ncbi:hypothetical protein SCG7086_BJ_00180 [Chlamydiales bacterium SCGC AG-110-P3]|nr:hypothetical protein SCG7086_BJ_00180 [Chlamydiales bacterium SCGC AG-110-P3]
MGGKTVADACRTPITWQLALTAKELLETAVKVPQGPTGALT